MKLWSIVLLAGALVAPVTWVGAQPAPTGSCAAKRTEINRSLDEAKTKGQKQRARGLERALSELNANCSDAKLKAQHQQNIRRQEQAVAKRERDLKEAERGGSAKKIEQRKAKLGEEREKLARLKE